MTFTYTFYRPRRYIYPALTPNVLLISNITFVIFIIPVSKQQNISQPYKQTTTTISKMSDSTSQSHAVGDSIVPQKLQEVLPKKVEEVVPNSIHDTGSGVASSHATGKSAVPKVR